MCVFTWVINGSIHRKTHDTRLSLLRCFKLSPVFLLLISLLPGVMSSFPLAVPWFSEQNYSACRPLQLLPGHLHTWETRAHLQMLAHTECCGFSQRIALIEDFLLALPGSASVSLRSHYFSHWFWHSWGLRRRQIDGGSLRKLFPSIFLTDTSPHILHACTQAEARLDGM